jgi:hypothetical protein
MTRFEKTRPLVSLCLMVAVPIASYAQFLSISMSLFVRG